MTTTIHAALVFTRREIKILERKLIMGGQIEAVWRKSIEEEEISRDFMIPCHNPCMDLSVSQETLNDDNKVIIMITIKIIIITIFIVVIITKAIIKMIYNVIV